MNNLTIRIAFNDSEACDEVLTSLSSLTEDLDAENIQIKKNELRGFFAEGYQIEAIIALISSITTGILSNWIYDSIANKKTKVNNNALLEIEIQSGEDTIKIKGESLSQESIEVAINAALKRNK